MQNKPWWIQHNVPEPAQLERDCWLAGLTPAETALVMRRVYAHLTPPHMFTQKLRDKIRADHYKHFAILNELVSHAAEFITKGPEHA